MSERVPLTPLWLAVGLDPIKEEVLVLGVAETESESKEQRSRAPADMPFRHSFLMTSDTFARDFHEWLIFHRVPRDEAVEILKCFAEQTKQLLEAP